VYIPAALLAQSGYIDIWFVYVITVVCVVTGDTVSYFIGRWLGKHIFIKGHRFFNPKLLHKGERFFEKHGKKAILFSKLIPAVPTVASMLAGANRMNTAIFILFDLISAVVTFFLFYTVWYLGTDVIFAALQSIVALFPFGL
jgi:membrane-associated protein